MMNSLMKLNKIYCPQCGHEMLKFSTGDSDLYLCSAYKCKVTFRPDIGFHIPKEFRPTKLQKSQIDFINKTLYSELNPITKNEASDMIDTYKEIADYVYVDMYSKLF